MDRQTLFQALHRDIIALASWMVARQQAQEQELVRRAKAKKTKRAERRQRKNDRFPVSDENDPEQGYSGSSTTQTSEDETKGRSQDEGQEEHEEATYEKTRSRPTCDWCASPISQNKTQNKQKL